MIKHDNDAVFLAVFDYVETKFEEIHYWQGPCSLSLTDLSYEKPKECSKSGPKQKLKLIDEFFLVLVRLRVGLFVDDLSDRFNISSGLVSKLSLP